MFSMTAIPPLAAAHVPILAGTDLGNPGTTAGVSLHGELEYLVEAGLTTLKALAAATPAAADSFHLTDRGRIAPGLRAGPLARRRRSCDRHRSRAQYRNYWEGGRCVGSSSMTRARKKCGTMKPAMGQESP